MRLAHPPNTPSASDSTCQTARDMPPHSRGTQCPGDDFRRVPQIARGRREDRVSTDTHGPRATRTHGAGTTGSAENTRPSLRDGFNVYRVLSSAHRAFWPPSPCRTRHPQGLVPASGDQDHTPSRPHPCCSSSSTSASTASPPHVRDDASVPLQRGGMGEYRHDF